MGFITTTGNTTGFGAVSLLHEGSSAADEKRCTCIIVDATSESSRRHTHTLPVSTTTDQLFEVVAKKLNYVKTTFTMTFSKSSPSSTEASMLNQIEPSKVQTLDDVGFSTKDRTYIQVELLNGAHPVPSRIPSISEHPGDDTSTDATESVFSRQDWKSSASIPPPPPVPPKIGAQRRNAVCSDDNASFSESISKAASKLKGDDFKGVDGKETRLVGLVNQAMTCYLNSLIQTLYMTPEFRNALYEWEYKGTETEASTTIPFQLQRLFLALQTSEKQAVETTDLTKSFGWDSSEAWQQHDIQELCRVMFDALEQKFKESSSENEKSDDTKSEDEAEENKPDSANEDEKNRNEPEIIKLYEGTMKDYVQCEECKNETCRNDTYLDIPITIRPFGSSVAYRDVMEGLQAFVEPETLDGSNQYFCEKCNKKCDAKKGLKFTSFPYLLTLQLKRFDFDYSTFHRVKLNDRMYFPETLDLNSFIEKEQKDIPKDQNSDKESECSADANEVEQEEEEIETSSRDSGNDDDRPCHSAQDQRRPVHVSDSEEGSSVDEGIEIESQSGQNGAISGSAMDDGIGSGSSTPGAIGGVVKNEDWDDLHGTVKPQGEYIYELFSIMIHSGSAVGGHYYAYIKSFDDGQWYSFNDQIVSPISEEDIEKSYGGSGSRSTYSSSFSSSTNAYMLMYRQIAPDRNKAYIKTEELPEHIKRLEKEEVEREKKMMEQKEKEKNMCSIKVYCRDPALMKRHNMDIVEEPFEFHNSITLRDATLQAYNILKLDEVGVEIKNCRLVKYDNYHQSLDQSLDDEEENYDKPLSMLLGGPRMSYLFDLLMETKQDHEHFDTYKTGGITIKVLPADYRKGCFLEHVIVRLMPEDTVYHLKKVIGKRLHYRSDRIRIAHEKYADVQLLSNASQKIKDTGVYRTMKLYVDVMDEKEVRETEAASEDSVKNYVYQDVKETRLWTLIDRNTNLINIEIELPEDARKYELPPSRPLTPPVYETPPSPTDSLPPLIDTSPPSEPEAFPKPPPGSVRSTPSLDEGVGSYEGSSGSNSVPKTAEGSTSASPRDRAQPVECQALLGACAGDGGLAVNQILSRFPQENENEGYTRLQEEDTSESQYDELPSASTHLRRNSEEDEGCSPGHQAPFQFPDDFQQELDRKLMGYHQSPTSSLKCEDGSSDSASQTSGEFEIQELTRQQGDGAADSAGSCSTIDSTGTLCNTTEETIGTNNEDSVNPYDHNTELASNSFINTNLTSLPGISCYAIDIPLPTAEEVAAETDIVAETGSLTVENNRNNSCDCDNGGPNMDTGPSYLCANCGRLKPGCMSSTLDNFTGGDKVSNLDPESGEGMDNITPLFADIDPKERGAGDSAPEVKPKYMELTTFAKHDSDDATRLRTESSSSVQSDLGYGDQNHTQHSYIRVFAVQMNDRKCQILKVMLDKRTTVGSLKKNLQPIVQIPTRDFSIYRVYQSGQETELNTLSDTFVLIPADARLRLKHQRALRKDEYRCKVFHLHPAEDDPEKHLVDWVVKKGLTIKEAKETVSQELLKQCDMSIKPENIRLRKKHVQSPGRIFLDTDVFGKDIIIPCNQETYLEILGKPEQKTSHDQRAVYCRRWRPESLTLDPIQEVIVGNNSDNYHPVDEMKIKLSEISGLEADNIEWAKPKGIFPCHMSVLEIHEGLSWDPPFVLYLDSSPININEDGSLIFFRDKNEPVKQLTEKERSELNQKEVSRLALVKNTSISASRSSSSRPSFRKEKALKIYTVGSSAKKKKDTTTSL